MRKLFSLGLLIFSIILAVILIFLASGYSFNRQQGQFIMTGIIQANSVPNGASVFVNGKLAAATDSSISGLAAGTYTIKISKNGYYDWQKDITVRAERVSEVEALLIPSAPILQPASYDGIVSLLVSPDASKAAMIFADPEKAGIWVLTFNNLPFGTFGSGYTIKQIVRDTATVAFSKSSLQWSGDSQDLLISLTESETEGNYLLSSDQLNTDPQPISESKSAILARWEADQQNLEIQRKKQLNESDLAIYSTAIDPVWSPDNLSFLFKNDSGYSVYSLEQQRLSVVKDLPLDATKMVTWHPNSRNIIALTEYSVDQKSGKIISIETDGGNKTTIYEGIMTAPSLLVAPDGRKILFLTSFNLSSPTSSLYSINLR